MVPLLWLITLAVTSCVELAGAATLSVLPDTLEVGSQPSSMTVIADGIVEVPPRSLQYIRLAICCGKTVFNSMPLTSPFGTVGGCTCTYTASFNTILIYLPDNCGLSAGTLTIVIPQAILTVNPAGEASASFSVGSNTLSGVIPYPGPSPSPSRSSSPSPLSRSPSRSASPSRSPSRSPASPSPTPSPRPSPLPLILTVLPDNSDPGVQATLWNITLQNVDPSTSRSFYISSTPSVFIKRSPSPDITVAGCTASPSSIFSSAVYFTLASGCGYGGTFSFILPGNYLAVNPSGSVQITVSIGVNTFRTTILFQVGSPSPSSSPSLSPSSSGSPSPASDSPSPDPSASPSPSDSPASASASTSPSTSPSASPSLSPSASASTSASPSPSESPSISPSASVSESPSPSPSNLPSNSPEASVSESPSPSPSDLPSDSPEASASPSHSPSPSEQPSDSPAASASTSPSPSPSELPSDSPAASASTSPSPPLSELPSGSPAASPSPSELPSDSPAASSSMSPSPSPSGMPSDSPAASASTSPSSSLSELPSDSPAASPSPSELPSDSPAASASMSPSPPPSGMPSDSPAGSASTSPSSSPSQLPSLSPAGSASTSPSTSPSQLPSLSPAGSASTSPSTSPSQLPSLSPAASASTSPSPSTSPSQLPSLSPAASASTSPSTLPSQLPSLSPSDSPSSQSSPSASPFSFATLPELLEALRARQANTVLTMQPEERQLIATAVPNTTLLVGPLCNTSVVAAVWECNQSTPLAMALGTNPSPERLVHCWGDGVEKAIVSTCTATVSGLQSLGLTPPPGLASAAVLHLLIVDRTDAVGNLLNHQPVSLVVPAAVPGNVSVLVYPGGDTVSQDLISLGGSVTAIPGGFLLASPHTSTFVTYQPSTAAPAATATAAEDNGWWIGLAAGLGSAAGLLLLAVPAIWLFYRHRASKREAMVFETYNTAPVMGDPYAPRHDWPGTVAYQSCVVGDAEDPGALPDSCPTPAVYAQA